MMITSTPREYGLDNLAKVTLTPPYLGLMDNATRQVRGSRAFRQRKLAEWHNLFALAMIASYRLHILFGDFAADALRVVVALRSPVPLEPDGSGALRRADTAVLGITWPEACLRMPMPGSSFCEVLDPQPVWHPNVAMKPKAQVCCLGVKLPIGIPVTEILLLAHFLLCMKAGVNAWDPAGVLNAEAAKWFQLNMHLLPLSREPFLLREDKT